MLIISVRRVFDWLVLYSWKGQIRRQIMTLLFVVEIKSWSWSCPYCQWVWYVVTTVDNIVLENIHTGLQNLIIGKFKEF